MVIVTLNVTSAQFRTTNYVFLLPNNDKNNIIYEIATTLYRLSG